MEKFRFPTVAEIKSFRGGWADFKELITVQPNNYELEFYHYQKRVLEALGMSASYHPERNFLYMTIRLISKNPDPLTDVLHNLADNGFTYKINRITDDRVSLKISW